MMKPPPQNLPTEPPADPPKEAGVFQNTLVDLLDTPPHMLTALRFVEDTARQTTGKRVVGELFQNARDAMVQRPREVGRLLVIIEPDALTVANDGGRWNLEGYESLTSMSRSEKAHRVAGGGFRPLVQGAIRPMGGQGIGFKAVLWACDSPQIYANTPGDGRFAIELGGPRIKALCAALAQADEEALHALLTPAEREVLDRELTPERPLAARSLPVHLGSRGVTLEALLDRLPTTPFPLWRHDVPERVAGLLGWSENDSELAEGGPYATVVRLPFKPGQCDRILDLIRDEIVPARQAFLGIRSKIVIKDEAKAEAKDEAKAEAKDNSA